ncbi:MAG TPA: PAS domain S-box protein, partial [Planctomycetaceae bacterium]
MSSADRRRRDGGGCRRSDLEFRSLLETLPAAAYTCDAGGLITNFNALAVELWGREPRRNDPADRYCGSFKLFSPDGTPVRHEECWMALALREGRRFDGREIVVERPDGSRRTALAHASPIRDESGALLGAVNVLVDITERKRTEETLRASERHLRTIVDTTPECIKVVDRDGTLVSMNAAGLGMCDADRADFVLGRSVYPIIADEYRESFREFNERVCRGEPGSLEFEITGLKGTRRRMETHAAPLPAGDGTFLHLAVTRDV